MNIISNCVNRFSSKMIFLKNKSTFLHLFKKFNVLASETTNSISAVRWVLCLTQGSTVRREVKSGKELGPCQVKQMQ